MIYCQTLGCIDLQFDSPKVVDLLEFCHLKHTPGVKLVKSQMLRIHQESNVGYRITGDLHLLRTPDLTTIHSSEYPDCKADRRTIYTTVGVRAGLAVQKSLSGACTVQLSKTLLVPHDFASRSSLPFIVLLALPALGWRSCKSGIPGYFICPEIQIVRFPFWRQSPT